ncbi:MAG: hypothetical protein IJZ88_04180 [Clostridia bacterium]|nr:hypothetical protein [Clostridia bacterium]
MKIGFLNTSSYKINISVDDGEYITLLPNENTSIEAQRKSTHKVSVKSATPSHYQRGFYFFNVITDYQLFESDEDIEFKISCDNYSTYSCINLIRAKMCVEGNECLFNAFAVENKEEIEKLFKRKRTKEFFFPDFLENIDVYIVLILIGIAIFYFSGWKIGLIYSAVSYGLLLLITNVLGKVWNAVFRRALRVSDDKTDFYNFINSSFLMQWFSDPKILGDNEAKEQRRSKRRKRRFFTK